MKRLRLAVPVLVMLALAGCSSASPGEFESQLEGIEGVDVAQVDGAGVRATLVYGISASDAETAIIEVRDQVVEAHERGSDALLTVFIPLEPGDDSNSTWELYTYGKWSGGSATGDDFEQQAVFVASLAEWDALLQTSATVEQVQLEVYGADDEPAVTIGQPLASGNDPTDITALREDLVQLWAASGGDPAEVVIR